ncbi:dual oxidase maturation factor 2 [Rhineura floridana]|uniref:dual oxidase maturation factor 2 n=1 Tax=Rhineura floridana TaxID=261503 RepID=UPI002AC88F31|nr:dual oxidase maturation factor 2 [Rhineura floridana]XP_061451049.1 dual oxidase maturation factor 2 [Rhineura floridana]
MTLYNGIYPFYPQPRKPFVFDVDTIIVIIVFLVFGFCFLLILPGIRGRARLYWLFRVIASLFIGGVIVAVQFTSDWERAQVTANTSYKSFSNATVYADIGLRVGLAGVNVTLVGSPVDQLNETIDYNEHFSWLFGDNYDNEFSEGLERGLPNPILYVAEKFTGNSPCGLHSLYRIAGHYASATLWVAFCAWLVSNMLFSMPVPVYGGYMILVTGAFIIFALLSFSTGRSSSCVMQFGHASLQLAYGTSFWLTLATGLLCFLIGIVVIVLHYACPILLKAFFDLCEDEEEDEGMLGEVYINPHVISRMQHSPSQPNFRLTITNS